MAATPTAWLDSAARRDAAFLAAAVVLSCAGYVSRLGFYSDDWAFLARYVNAPDQTLLGLYHASFSQQHAMRPVQLWLCAALYRAFGLQPLGYHVVNMLLLVVNPLLLYATVRGLNVARTIALPIALVYAVLPSYSTDRYWYVAFAITFSMTGCLAAMLAALRAADAGRSALPWAIASAAALLVSALAYEVALPLVLIVPLLMFLRIRRTPGPPLRRRLVMIAVVVACHGVLLAGVAQFKLRTTVRLGAQRGEAAQIADITGNLFQRGLPYGHYGLNVFSAVRVHFQEYGLLLPATAMTVARTAPPGVLWLTAAFALLSFGYLTVAFRASDWPRPREWIALMPSGLIVFGLGYAIFLTNYNVQFTATGVANRTAIAAAAGAAIFTVGCVGWVASLLPARRTASVCLALLVSAVASFDFLIVNAVAERWATAYQTERQVLAEIRRQLPTLPHESTLILDGVCPYDGPAIVFESNWDLAGALQAAYRDPTLTADVVTPRLRVGDLGLTTTTYEQPTTYPYRSDLLVFRPGASSARSLPTAADARAYFAARAGAPRCPEGREGVGVRLF